MKKMNNKGFSLIELIIVIAIMAVLVAVIAPNLTGYIGKSKVNSDNSNADTIESTLSTCLQDFVSDETIGSYFSEADLVDCTTIDQIITKSKAINGEEFAAGDIKCPTANKDKVKSAFEDNVYKALNKYVDASAKRIIPKQDDFTYFVKIEGTYDSGFTCRVKCAKTDKWDPKNWKEKADSK